MLEEQIYAIIGKRIRNYRKRAGYSQEALAKKAGLFHAYLGQIERGESKASLRSIFKIANALEMPLEILFENIIQNEKDPETLSSEAYELIDSLTSKEQKAIIKLLKEIIEYRKLEE
ncbi:TPA: helix-turn-helix domain-containing protein [Clostridioides difficile]|uniref:Helix-turn-helix domain-containing protein n=1 Tax=Clostridioides difficile TaxID=1496 RepID=A0AAN6A5S7_CLODI|nr:helix-turn-helix domain-containing protein [Clostridioides difficile]EGT3943997.1 helix-turn-helix domain-containing protein [Clostridioides difficile]MBG0197946.1 helix-turn-helix domain-containing protein [Clostridioides difficile]MCA0574603.1 helix-turn-helix domain-containing protein [Clostridioides difficile]MCM0739710.1 helix-turn-helix domain-containing protein [Clostridioides difficile]MDW0076908.1 helix-turn-helix domain-containing protein [Clostridioides difficile]